MQRKIDIRVLGKDIYPPYEGPVVAQIKLVDTPIEKTMIFNSIDHFNEFIQLIKEEFNDIKIR